MPGCNIFLGGTIGENAHLSLEPAVKGVHPSLSSTLRQKRNACYGISFFVGVPLEHDILVPKLEELIIEHFGGTPRPAPSAGAGGLLAKVNGTSPPQRAV